MQVHHCDNNDSFSLNPVKNPIRKSSYQTAPDLASNYGTKIGVQGHCFDGPFNFRKKIHAKTRGPRFIVLRSGKHLLLGGREEEGGFHLSLEAASWKVCVAGFRVNFPARYA